ncbi:MAG: RusA family crossover junction endodeoxyribonuclease [Paenibacillaceae bacterium]
MEKLILPELPPSVNHYYENRVSNYIDKSGQPRQKRMRILTPDSQRWFDNAVVITNLWRNKNKWITAKGKVIVRLWFYFPNARHIDTHNGLKALLDAFEDALIYGNDKNALPWIMDFEVDKINPRLVVEFERVNKE